MKKIVATLTALTFCASAQAEFFSGNDIHQRLSDSDPFVRGLAAGFVAGVFDVGQRVWHCAPNTVSVGQVRDLAKAYLENSPGIRHQPAEKLMRELHEAAWPCPKSSRNQL